MCLIAFTQTSLQETGQIPSYFSLNYDQRCTQMNMWFIKTGPYPEWISYRLTKKCPRKQKVKFLKLTCLLLKKSFMNLFEISLLIITSRANVEKGFSILTPLSTILSQSPFTCSKVTIGTLEQGVKYVQS